METKTMKNLANRMAESSNLTCGAADWPCYWFINTDDLEAGLWRLSAPSGDLWPGRGMEPPNPPAVDPSSYTLHASGEVTVDVAGGTLHGLMTNLALDAHGDARLPAIFDPESACLHIALDGAWHRWDARPVPGSRRGDHGLSEAEWPTDRAGLAALVARYLRSARTDLDPADRDRLLDWFSGSAAAPWHGRPAKAATTQELIADEDYLAQLRVFTAESAFPAAPAEDTVVASRPAHVDRLSRLSTSFDEAVSTLLQSPDYRSRAGDAPILCEWLAHAMLELPGVDPEDTLARARRFTEGRVAQTGRRDLYPLLLRLRSGVGVSDRAAEAKRIGRVAHDLSMSRVELSDILHAQYTPTLAPDWCAVHRGVLRGFDAEATSALCSPDSLDRNGLFPAETDRQALDAASAAGNGLAAACISVATDELPEQPAPLHILIQVSGGMVEKVCGTAPFRVTLQDFDIEDVTEAEEQTPVVWDAAPGVVLDPDRFEQELRRSEL
jgi:hypothetical protein